MRSTRRSTPRWERLPAGLDVLADEAVVDVGGAGQLVVCERREGRDGGVLADLLGVAGAGNHDADAGLVDDPSQRELGHRLAGLDQLGELADGGEADLEGDPGERLADV